MLIGGNNNNNNFSNQMKNNFNKETPYKQNQNNGKRDFGFKENINTYKHTNPTDELAMYDKSIAMLHERLDKKTISIEEFNKQCEIIGKKKANALKNKNNY